MLQSLRCMVHVDSLLVPRPNKDKVHPRNDDCTGKIEISLNLHNYLDNGENQTALVRKSPPSAICCSLDHCNFHIPFWALHSLLGLRSFLLFHPVDQRDLLRPPPPRHHHLLLHPHRLLLLHHRRRPRGRRYSEGLFSIWCFRQRKTRLYSTSIYHGIGKQLEGNIYLILDDFFGQKFFLVANRHLGLSPACAKTWSQSHKIPMILWNRKPEAEKLGPGLLRWGLSSVRH